TGAPALIGAAIALNAGASGGANTGGLTVDGRRNRLFFTYFNIWDTAQTMLAAPLVPTFVVQPTVGRAPTDAAVAPDQGVVWASSTQGANTSNIGVYQEWQTATNNPGNYQITSPLNPTRIIYNQAGGTMVIASPGTLQIGLYDVSTRTLTALFAIPAVVNG